MPGVLWSDGAPRTCREKGEGGNGRVVRTPRGAAPAPGGEVVGSGLQWSRPLHRDEEGRHRRHGASSRRPQNLGLQLAAAGAKVRVAKERRARPPAAAEALVLWSDGAPRTCREKEDRAKRGMVVLCGLRAARRRPPVVRG